MKKNIRIASYIFIIIILFGCNKNSQIEGVSTKGTEVIIDKTFFLGRVANGSFTTTLSNNQLATFSVQTVATRGMATTTAYTTNDSIQYLQFYPPNGVNFAFSSLCLNKYAMGSDLSSVVYAPPSNGNFINFSKRTPPFTTPYISITSTFTISGFGTITPKFGLNDNGYIAFKRLVFYSGATPVYEYGWIQITFSQNNITFNKMGYRLDSPLKAGSLED